MVESQTCAMGRVRICVQLGLSVFDPTDCNLPGSSVHGVSQARYCSRLPFSPPGDLPTPGVEPEFPSAPALQADSLPPSHRGKPLVGRA